MHGLRIDARFCSHACRQAVYRGLHPKPGKPRAASPAKVVLECLNCSEILKGKQRMFCSDRCRKQYHRDSR